MVVVVVVAAAVVVLLLLAAMIHASCRYDETGGFVSWRLLLLNLLHFV